MSESQHNVFTNDAVTAQVESEVVDSMIPSNISKILIIYTGGIMYDKKGTIGMKNTHHG
jgi:hypothetical protein